MDVRLITVPKSPTCHSVRMYLNMLGVKYSEFELSEEEGRKLGEMPVVLIDDNEETRGFKPQELKDIFG